MKETVKRIIEKYVSLSEGTTLIVGFSGGWDSMCLLHIVNLIAKERGFRLVAAHLNHNWRGKESEAEEQKCRQFCLDSNIKFVSKKLSSDLKPSEVIAREMRYAFFKDCAIEFNASAILTAHTRSDNAETILYRIIKGTGLNGLEGIKECRDIDSFKVIRPVLNYSRKDIEKYCIQNELYPNSDSSNLNTKYARNNIRHNIMPQLKILNPNIENSLITLADIAIGNNKVINELIQNIENQISVGEKWLTQNFLLLDMPIRQHFVYNLLLRNDIEPSFSKVQEILTFIQEYQFSKSGKTISLTSDSWLFTSHKYTYIIHKEEEFKCHEELDISTEGKYNYASMYEFVMEKFDEDIKNFPKSTGNIAYVDMSKIIPPVTIRTRKNGDIIQPFGMNGKMKFKKYLINKNIPSHDRDKIILLCSGNEILWAIGIGISEKLRVTTKPTHKLKLETIGE